jgi:hypothetical protein
MLRDEGLGLRGTVRPVWSVSAPHDFQISTCSAMASASSTSMPRYRTVLSEAAQPLSYRSCGK